MVGLIYFYLAALALVLLVRLEESILVVRFDRIY